MYLNIFIILLILIIYLISPIKFSGKKISYSLNYNTTLFYLFNIVILIELLQLYPKVTLFKYWIIFPFLVCYSILDIIHQPIVTDDGKLNIPPNYLSKTIIIHILLIILLGYNCMLSNFNYLGVINIILILILLILQIKYKSCYYELPNSWNRL
jgi:hypothetical protein